MKSILFLLAFAFLMVPGSSRAEDKPAPVTVTAGALQVCLDDAIFTQKKGYVHLMFDAFPYAAQIKAAHLTSLSSVAQALVEGEGLKKFTAEKHYKIDVVEVLERDEYGLPRWDQVKLKEGFLGEVAGKKVTLVPKNKGK